MARNLRIITGIILFLFTTSHLLNQSLGLHSLQLMDASRPTFMAPWSNPIGSFLLMGSLIIHMILTLVTLYKRNTLVMSSADTIQFASGFLILPLLIPHIVGIKLATEIIPGYQPDFRGILNLFWVQNPFEGLRQILVVVVVWIHGVIGLLTYFRLKSWWAYLGPVINPVVVLIPICALLGFVEAGKEVIAVAANATPFQPSKELLEAFATINAVKWSTLTIYGVILGMVLIARHFRLRKYANYSNINYLHGPQIITETGANLLEVSIENDVPHANFCRGRGRCGTCQVRIVSSQHPLPEPTSIEQVTLDRVDAAKDIRLACQLKPLEGELVIERVIPPYITPVELKEILYKKRSQNAPPTPTIQKVDA